MSIYYNSIPTNLREPGFYFEFDPSRANTGSVQKRMVFVGQRLAGGSVAAGTPVRVTRDSESDVYFGRGSQLAAMLRFGLKCRPNMDVWAIALNDLGGGQAAIANIVLTNPATNAGTLRIDIGDDSVRVGVAIGQLSSALASAIVAAINARTEIQCTAAINGGNTSRIDLTARNKGTCANDLMIQVRFETDSQPAAPLITVTPFAGGTGNPDITDAIAAMGDEWYNWIIFPWTDSPNMTALETELDSRFSALRSIGARAFTAYRGSYGQAAGFGIVHNSPHISCEDTALSQSPPHIWAAINGVIAANSLANNPAQQLTYLALPYLQAPAPEDRRIFTERNNLSFDGMSTYTVRQDGTVQINNQLTMYQRDPMGNADDSQLHINVPEVYEEYRRLQKLLFAPHARDMLADDGNNIPVGQPIMTPKKARAMLLGFYRRMIEVVGWCEDFDHYEATLLVEKEGNRLKFVDQPNFIDNMRQVYGRSELVN